RRVHADDFRIGLAIGWARIAVERAATHAWTGARDRAVLFVQQNPERHVERVQALLREGLGQLLHPWFVRDGRKRIRAGAMLFGRVFAGHAVHVEKFFRFIVIRREHIVLQRPFWRDAVGMADFL